MRTGKLSISLFPSGLEFICMLPEEFIINLDTIQLMLPLDFHRSDIHIVDFRFTHRKYATLKLLRAISCLTANTIKRQPHLVPDNIAMRRFFGHAFINKDKLRIIRHQPFLAGKHQTLAPLQPCIFNRAATPACDKPE